MTKLKPILFSFIFLAFLAQFSLVFALEIKYPPIPGAQTPEEILKLPPDQRLPLYLNYYVRFFFAFAIGITVILITYGGIAYLFSGARPAWALAARERINQGLLGLFILVSSYLILGLINPQFLVFKIKRPLPPPPPITLPKPEQKKEVTYFRISIGTLVDEALEKTTKLVLYERPEDIKTEYKDSLPPKIADLIENYEGHKIPEIAKPILDTLFYLESVNDKINKIIKEFKNCQCGKSHYHVEGKEFLRFECIPGKRCLADKNMCLEYACLSPPSNSAYTIEELKKIAKDDNLCIKELKKIAKDDNLCSVQIDEKGNIVKPDNTYPVCLFTCENRCRDCGTSDDCEDAINRIKEYRQSIQKGLSQIETLKKQININQIELLSNTLATNATEFLVKLLGGYSFQEDYNYQETNIKELGYEINYEVHPLHPEESRLVKMSPEVSDRLTYYAPLKGEIFDSDLTNENQRICKESKIFSLFAVLARLSLEELKNILGQCFTMAFGEAGFELADETINNIIEQAFKEGLAIFLKDELAKHSDDYALAFEAKLRKGVSKKTKENFKKNCTEQCCQKDCETKGKSPNECEKECKNEENISEECKKKCKEESGKIKKMATGLSRLLMDILLVDVREHLPRKIQEYLSRELKDVILAKETQAFLDKDLIEYLREPLNFLLTTNIKDLSPDLKRFLDKKIVDFLPKKLGGFFHHIDSSLQSAVTFLKEKIPAKIKNFTKKLEEKLDQTAANLISKLPGSTNVENLSPSECCNKFIDYYFDRAQGIKGKCLKTTIDKINEGNTTGILSPNRMLFYCGDGVRKSIKQVACEKLGGSWVTTPAGTGYCKGSGTEIYHKDVAGFFDFKRWAKNFGQSIFTAFTNLPQQLFMALYQTTKHIVIQYTKVWVEDEMIIPFKFYAEKLQNLQKDFKETLAATAGDLLPPQTAGVMEKDIDQILKDICEAFMEGKDITNWQTKCKNLPDKEYSYTIKKGLIKKVIKIPAGKTKEIRQKMCKYACSAYRILHLDLYDALGPDINNALKTKVIDLLLSKKYKEILDKSLAELLWPEITNIKNLLIGTPKQVICGDLIADHSNGFMVKTGGQTPLKDTCNSASLRTTKETMGLLPYLDKESDFWKGLTDNDKQIYAYTCPFIWYICQNPLSEWTKTVGNLIAEVLEIKCQLLDNKIKGYCQEPAGGGCKECQKITPDDSIFCEACDRLNKTLAYSVFRYGMEQNYQLEPYKVKLADTNPYLPGEAGYNEFIKEKENKQKERAAYQWLYVAFKTEPYLDICKCTRKMREKIKQVALGRGFTQQEWDGLEKEVENWNNLNVLPDGTQAIAITLVSWLTEENTLYDILTDIPFGVLKPLKPGQPTLLREANKTSKKEFLAYTPYEILKNEVCRKVIEDYTLRFPTSTIPAIMKGEYLKIRPRAYIPYSVESLKAPNSGQALQILLANKDIDWRYKSQYLTCYVLDQNPAGFFGLNQNLIYYVNPPEYRVLFVLIRDKLKPDERPKILNKLLKWLFEKTPVDLLKAIRKKETIGCRCYIETKHHGWSNKESEWCSLKCDAIDKQNNRHEIEKMVQSDVAQIGCIRDYTVKNPSTMPISAVPMVANGVPHPAAYGNYTGNIPFDFWQYQGSKCPWGWKPYFTNNKPWTTTKITTTTVDKILGEGNAAKEGCADEKGTQRGSCGPKTGCYRLTTEKKIESIEILARFLETTMGQYVEQSLPNKKIIELIFEEIFPCCNEEKDCIINGELKGKGNLYGRYCPLYKKLSREEWQGLQEFLLHTPLELLKKYLKQPLLDNEWVAAKPIMDRFPADSLINQPYLDTIGRWTGLDEVVGQVLITKSEFDTKIDEAAISTVELIQETFDKILREYPTKAISFLTQRLGFGLGENLGGSVAEQMLGKCWDEPDKSKCETADKPNQFYNEKTKQCCDSGDPLVCQPRCRENPIGECWDSIKAQCTEQGQFYNDVTKKCCLEGKMCKIMEGEGKVIKVASDGEVISQCCYSYPNPCSLCREATSDEIDRRECKRNPNKEKFKTIDAPDPDGEDIYLCCWDRKCQGECAKEPAVFNDQCCVSIMDCMNDRFIYLLEKMVTDAIREGPLLESLK